jgi:hypothetical protein
MVPPHNAGEIDPRRRITRAKQQLGLNGWGSALTYPFRATLADGRAMLLDALRTVWRIREYWRSAIGKLVAAERRGSGKFDAPRVDDVTAGGG